MSENSNEEPGLIKDEDLPEDLQPTDDNPLAKDPDDDADPGLKPDTGAQGLPAPGAPGAAGQ
ncbi:MAG: hypothetical protein ACXVYS_18720 [Oryzihumus sp.]